MRMPDRTPDPEPPVDASEVPSTPSEISDENSVNDDAMPDAPPANNDHQPHLNCPDTLACLPDTDGRPQHTLPVILRCAILGSPKQRLTIREIYAAMEGKYAYYRTAGPTWKVRLMSRVRLFCLTSNDSAICAAPFVTKPSFRTTTASCN